MNTEEILYICTSCGIKENIPKEVVEYFDEMDQDVYKRQELNQKGVTVLFQDINKDTASSEDSLILNLLLTLSQEESKNISERTKFGNMATAKANKIRNNGLYGYHYIKETNSLIINENEAEVVRKMFDL